MVRCDPVYCLESVSLSKTVFAGVLIELSSARTGAPYLASILANKLISSPAYLASKPPTFAALAGLWRRKYLRVSRVDGGLASLIPHTIQSIDDDAGRRT